MFPGFILDFRRGERRCGAGRDGRPSVERGDGASVSGETLGENKRGKKGLREDQGGRREVRGSDGREVRRNERKIRRVREKRPSTEDLVQ